MDTVIPNISQLHEQNQSAWETLYREASGSVWGPDPIPFVEEFVSEMAGEWSSSTCVLDAASGEGRHLPSLVETGVRVHACDSSESALERVALNHGTVDVCHCGLDRIPYPAEKFDFISLIDTIETLPDPISGLTELHRVMKTGGHLLCNIPGIEDEISGEKMAPLDGLEDGSFLYAGAYYYRFYSEEEALAMIESCGFSIVRNDVRSWEESSHPGFRDYEHQHTSRVFLLKK